MFRTFIDALKLPSLSAIIFASFLTLAYSADLSVHHQVINNNRIFQNSQQVRLIRDLELYIFCAGVAYTDNKETCDKHKRFKNCPSCYPDLRGGTTPYATRYNPHFMAYDEGYVWDRKRQIKFELKGADAFVEARCTWYLKDKLIDQTPCSEAVVTSISLEDRSDTTGKLSFAYDGKLTLKIEQGASVTQTLEHHFSVRDFLIVAIGDSYMSGEGNPHRNADNNEGRIEWLDYRCNRSSFNYVQLMVARLAHYNPSHSFTLVDVSCSGAEIYDGIYRRQYVGRIEPRRVRSLFSKKRLSAPKNQSRRRVYAFRRTIPTQVVQVVRTIRETNDDKTRLRSPDLVLVSTGGNDLGFGELLRKIVLSDLDQGEQRQILKDRDTSGVGCDWKEYVRLEDGVPSVKRLERPVHCLKENIEDLSKALDDRILPKNVVLMDYLNPHMDRNGKTCMGENEHSALMRRSGDIIATVLKAKELFTGNVTFSEDETLGSLKYFFQPLRRQLRLAAFDIGKKSASGWSFFSFEDLSKTEAGKNFERRGFCDPVNRWFYNYRDAVERVGKISLTVSTGIMHPNIFGHFNISSALLDQIVNHAHFKQFALTRGRSDLDIVRDGF